MNAEKGNGNERSLELKLKPFELRRAGSNPSSMNDSALVINDKEKEEKEEKEMRTLNANL